MYTDALFLFWKCYYNNGILIDQLCSHEHFTLHKLLTSQKKFLSSSRLPKCFLGNLCQSIAECNDEIVIIGVKQNHHVIFLALVALKLLVSLISRLIACSARIVADKQTHRTTTVTLTAHGRGLMMRL